MSETQVIVTLANEQYSEDKNIDALMNTTDVTDVKPIGGDPSFVVIQESELLNSMLDPRGANPEVALVGGPYATLDDAIEWMEEEYGSYPDHSKGGPNIYIACVVQWRKGPES